MLILFRRTTATRSLYLSSSLHLHEKPSDAEAICISSKASFTRARFCPCCQTNKGTPFPTIGLVPTRQMEPHGFRTSFTFGEHLFLIASNACVMPPNFFWLSGLTVSDGLIGCQQRNYVGRKKTMTRQQPKVALVITTQNQQQHHDSSSNICVYPVSAEDLLLDSDCRCDSSIGKSREKRSFAFVRYSRHLDRMNQCSSHAFGMIEVSR